MFVVRRFSAKLLAKQLPWLIDVRQTPNGVSLLRRINSSSNSVRQINTALLPAVYSRTARGSTAAPLRVMHSSRITDAELEKHAVRTIIFGGFSGELRFNVYDCSGR